MVLSKPLRGSFGSRKLMGVGCKVAPIYIYPQAQNFTAKNFCNKKRPPLLKRSSFYSSRSAKLSGHL